MAGSLRKVPAWNPPRFQRAAEEASILAPLLLDKARVLRHGQSDEWYCGAGPMDKIAVCAIFKDEAPYLLEWLAFQNDRCQQYVTASSKS